MRSDPRRIEQRPSGCLTALLALLLTACGSTPAPRASGSAQAPAAGPDSAAAIAKADRTVVVAERFSTPASPADEIDSLATWRAPDGTTWLLATAKSGARVLIYDAATGAPLGSLPADGADEPLLRPNGIAVSGDIAFVVDQQRRRVDLLHLPDGSRVASFGEDVLRNPYGLWVNAVGPGEYSVYVTDSYRLPDGSMPPAEQLGERVRHFRVAVGVVAQVSHEADFGATGGPGVLLTVESIAGDPLYDRLLIAEEELDAPSGLRVYRLDGSYAETSIGSGVYAHQAEGVVLAGCEDGSGYWIGSDQHASEQRFHVLDRATLRHVGAFRGEIARDTDGLAFTRGPLPGFPHGALYAQHDNRAVVAFDWAKVAKALGLEPGCD